MHAPAPAAFLTAAFLTAAACGMALLFAGCHQAADDMLYGRGYDPEEFHLIKDNNSPNYPEKIYHGDLPDRKVVTNFDELRRRGLFDRVLAPRMKELPWSSGFFPGWFGGVSGRWQDNHVALLWRSLTGFGTLEADEAFSLVGAAAADAAAAMKLYDLAPTEKYDLAVGDYAMLATKMESLLRGHNQPAMARTVPFWSGYCNGLAIASLAYPEPFREVDAVSPDGYRIRFHPYDIKGLLGLAQAGAWHMHWQVGNRCNENRTDTLDCGDVNPAAFVLTLLNRIGIAGKSLIIDVNPLSPVINTAVRTAKVTLLSEPRAATGEDKPIARVVDVRIEVEGASTLLREWASDVRLPGEGVFAKVNAPKMHSYDAELALDEDGELIGGRWSPPRYSGPDFAWGVPDDPAVSTELADHLIVNPFIRYSVLMALLEASTSASPERPTVAIAKALRSDAPDLFVLELPRPSVQKVHKGKMIRIYGRAPSRFEHMSCVSARKDVDSPDDRFTLSYAFPESPGTFSYFEVDADAPDVKATSVHCDFYGRDGRRAQSQFFPIRPPVKTDF